VATLPLARCYHGAFYCSLCLSVNFVLVNNITSAVHASCHYCNIWGNVDPFAPSFQRTAAAARPPAVAAVTVEETAAPAVIAAKMLLLLLL
jgi:hypothetical protein